jgi:hypothetical protein
VFAQQSNPHMLHCEPLLRSALVSLIFRRGSSKIVSQQHRSSSGKVWNSSIDAKGNELAGADDRKGRGLITALEIERFVLDAVDVNYLTWV